MVKMPHTIDNNMKIGQTLVGAKSIKTKSPMTVQYVNVMTIQYVNVTRYVEPNFEELYVFTSFQKI